MFTDRGSSKVEKTGKKSTSESRSQGNSRSEFDIRARQEAERAAKAEKERLTEEGDNLYEEYASLLLQRENLVEGNNDLLDLLDEIAQDPAYHMIMTEQRQEPIFEIERDIQADIDRINSERTGLIESAAEYSKARKKHIKRCLKYNQKVIIHNSTSSGEDYVDILDIDRDHTAPPFEISTTRQ